MIVPSEIIYKIRRAIMEKVNNFLNHVLPKILSVILVFLIFTSMIDSNLIQGCGRVVNIPHPSAAAVSAS